MYSQHQHKKCAGTLPRAPSLARLHARARRWRRRGEVLEWWNSGRALDPESSEVEKWLQDCATRARRDATARSTNVRSHYKGKGNVLKHTNA